MLDDLVIQEIIRQEKERQEAPPAERVYIEPDLNKDYKIEEEEKKEDRGVTIIDL